MKKSHLALTGLTLLCSAFALNFSKVDQPPFGYVQIEGEKSGRLKGSQGSPEWDINITSFTYNQEDRAHHIQASVVFSKPLDEASGEIQSCLNSNENLPRVEFQLFHLQGKKQVVYETIELKNATIKKIDQNGANETISLQFQTIQTNYN